ncbi:protein takeout isoform X2 [Nilaparvata lugens]|uniref:protein takeout isoform X2 n=1 Tax=Nilaparvata lugens TaxID=108931 RepID=UPI00193D59B9|nr:protein takeout isoform X2 [Nilaparvata lugens]
MKSSVDSSTGESILDGVVWKNCSFSRKNCCKFQTKSCIFALTVFLIHLSQSEVSALKLPPYISPCKKSDVDLDACVVKHGQQAIPKFINGDPKYRVPKLDPLEITELVVNQGTRQIGLSLRLKNTKIYGLRNAKFVKSTTDFKRRHCDWHVNFDRIQLIGKYIVDGKILVLPISGEGPCNVTITDLKITYKYDWDLIKKANGKEYMNFTKSEINFENGRTYFKLENLFNGDKTLGDNMNYFLNENWKEVTQELGPAVGEAISEVFRLLLTNIADLVPYEYIYPD